MKYEAAKERVEFRGDFIHSSAPPITCFLRFVFDTSSQYGAAHGRQSYLIRSSFIARRGSAVLAPRKESEWCDVEDADDAAEAKRRLRALRKIHEAVQHCAADFTRLLAKNFFVVMCMAFLGCLARLHAVFGGQRMALESKILRARRANQVQAAPRPLGAEATFKPPFNTATAVDRGRDSMLHGATTAAARAIARKMTKACEPGHVGGVLEVEDLAKCPPRRCGLPIAAHGAADCYTTLNRVEGRSSWGDPAALVIQKSHNGLYLFRE